MEKQVSTRHGGHLEALLNGCPDAILAINAEGIIKFANKEACKLTERNMNELIGESIVEVYESIEAARDANRKIYQAGGTIHDMETKTKTKSGKIIPVRVSASHLYDSNGKYIGGVGYFAKYRPWGGAEAQIKARVEQLESKLENLKTLASPVCDLYPGLAITVLEGGLDADRFNDISSALLDHVEKNKTRVVVINISGAVVDDAEVPKQLAKSIRTVRLVGTECIIVGMQAGLAQAIEPLLTDLGSLRAFNSMDVALQEAFKTIGYEIRKKD
jgi:PAS domain S-box-containing protein